MNPIPAVTEKRQRANREPTRVRVRVRVAPGRPLSMGIWKEKGFLPPPWGG